MPAYPPQGEHEQPQTGAPVQAAAVHAHTPAERHALSRLATLSMVTIGIALVLGMAALVVLSRYRRRVLGGPKGSRRTRTADAWAEAGKRMEPPPPPPEDGSRDETVDIDPEDLGPGDVGPGGGFDPHGEPPDGRGGGRGGRR